ncbi:amidohydrolase [Streptomyces paromomycinus]|uniref:Amidohydrolase n=1 Tax=Streptomyces paromomycinus TaxID=92743 RepID=A0A401WFX8_STREY|nr:amidohydrolase [Streptomyces paromomycinus]
MGFRTPTTAAVSVAVLSALLLAQVPARADTAPASLTDSGVRAHVDALQRIADRNGGNRASGTNGYAESLDYVEQRLKKAGYEVERQPFGFLFTQVLTERLTLPGGKPVPVIVAKYSPSTPAKGLTARFAALTGPEERRQGCAPASYDGATVTGRIALVGNGGCTMDDKGKAAAAAGAAAVVVINDRAGELYGWLKDAAGARIPVSGVSPETGEALTRAARQNAPGTLTLRSRTEKRTTENLIARTRAGDPAHQVISGAHLDSVPETAGINDNGAAVAVLLESALRGAQRPAPKNQLVFAFWGAEEFDMLGSQYFVDRLTPAQRKRVAAYLNLEMIGGPNSGLFTMDGKNADPEGGITPPNGSADIADRLTRAFAEAGEVAQTWKLDGRSDYAPFMKAGIPAGGLNGGSFELKTAEQARLWGGTAGQPFDPCYHQVCDNAGSFNATAARKHGDAFVRTLDHFAGTAVARTDRAARDRD